MSPARIDDPMEVLLRETGLSSKRSDCLVGMGVEPVSDELRERVRTGSWWGVGTHAVQSDIATALRRNDAAELWLIVLVDVDFGG